MQLKDVMTEDPIYVKEDASIKEVAQKMKDNHCGAILVGKNDRLTGFITDRDIALRVVAEGKDPEKTIAGEISTPKVLYFFEDQEAEEALQNMQDNQIVRLVVLNRDKRLTGIVSHSDIAEAVTDNELYEEEIGKEVTQLASLKCAA